MPLPVIFANLPTGNNPAATTLDAMFTALSGLVPIQCTALGATTIALTPTANSPTLSAYQTLQAVAFTAVGANAAGGTTVNLAGLGAKPLRTPIAGVLVELPAGLLQAGTLVFAVYDGTQFQMYPGLPTSGVAAGTYGDSTHVSQVTIDSTGRVTGASSVAISGGSGTVTSISQGTGMAFSVNPITTTGTINIANGGVGSAQIAAGAVGQSQLASGAVHQGQLSVSTGSVSASTGTATDLTLPGGSYGFYPQIKSSGGTITATIAGAGIFGGTSYTTNIELSVGTAATASAQQTYINASPPYDLGDGPVNGFIFLAIDKVSRKVVATYIAPDPPWAYNGPPRADKNANMALIPHPFPGIDTTKFDIALADPLSLKTASIIARLQAGESVNQLFHDDVERVGGAPLVRKGPPGVVQLAYAS